ncbi:Pimeloyl-ACP methyl ester carboxylesterase [Rhizobiales bacterium GAS191]|nr:Pimeloyl-ACP methyl ester carboxylesterase [Rhizobiales bacterium GAS191]
MTAISHISTPLLDIAYEEAGPRSGRPVILLHGWPDDARTWDRVLPSLHGAGLRTFSPYLRGFGPTRFRSAATPRSGQLTALAQDALDLATALGLGKFVILGHDWGARAAYIATAIAPERISHCVSLSVGWGTNHSDQALSLRQARNYWYHWFMALERGAEAFRRDGEGFARLMWDSWGPQGWYSQAEFAATARSFANPDWTQIVLHSYRHRWGNAEGDPAYDPLEIRVRSAPVIQVPTLVIHGAVDGSNDQAMSAGREGVFSGPYRRFVLDGVGHFPSREVPEPVAKAVIEFLEHHR